ncbi:MAG: chorismate synthase, partial [Eubacteriales bacterium]|nr:chorismate synthase [Eubacteriales bacterium]
EGRHDPCIAPRALPVVEAAAAVFTLDLLLDALPDWPAGKT